MSSTEPINILIVDDEVRNLTVLETVLESPDYRIVRADSADKALLALVADEFAVLILDVRMPDMTGFELAQMIKQRKRTAQIPIIFLTAYYNEDQHVLEGYDSGAVDYLHKPVNPAVLRSKVSVFAQLYRKSREASLANETLLSEIRERRHVEEQLRELSESLEQRVHERTEALVDSEQRLANAQRQLQQHAENLERMVHERSAKLRETVHDLEAFSYSIAHDMRGPLRAMQGFSEILITDHAGKLDADAGGYLHRIAVAARRMDRLIVDILNYGEMVRGELKLKPVDVEQLIHEITATYPTLQAGNADIAVQGPIPAVMANEAALTQVVSNLLGNAVKFVAPGVRPRVSVRSEDRNGVFRVWFEDNAIGIPKEAHERVFDIFTRLQRREDYEGTGIGLAIVRKAVERMGGKVGLESEVGRGSRFWVQLQKATAA